MRIIYFTVLGGFIASTIFFSTIPTAQAQGQFCATYDDNSPEDCSFTTFAMCQQSISGVGGDCAPASSAPPMPAPPLFHLFPAPPNPAAVPPPPIQQPSPGPLQLPDASQ
jgi:Protein of unknown function (DUF3551)